MFSVQTSYSISRICSVDRVAASKADCDTFDPPPPPPPDLDGEVSCIVIDSVSVLVSALIRSIVSAIVIVSVSVLVNAFVRAGVIVIVSVSI